MRRILISLGLALGVFALALHSVRAGIVLEASTDALEVVTSSAASIDYNCSWTDQTTTAFTPGKSAGNIAAAATTTVVAAPAASTQRNILNCTFRNASTTTANTLTVQRDVSATNRTMFSATLNAGEALLLTQEGEFQMAASDGVLRSRSSDIAGFSGRAYGYAKASTAKDSAGYWIALGKDNGYPGAMVLGAPGLNGAVLDCSTGAGATVAGANVIVDAATGSYFLTSAQLMSSNTELANLIDVLWYNTGLVVTTTGAQAIGAPVALPARDINGTTNGEGVYAALLSTAANTNAAVIANTTISYTDQDGNAGAVGGFAAAIGWQAPATPVIGTWMPMGLAAGDRGVRSVQSVTLGTSYVTGSLSLILYRPLATLPNLALIGTSWATPQFFVTPGVRVYNDTCVWATLVGAAGASTLTGVYTIMER